MASNNSGPEGLPAPPKKFGDAVAANFKDGRSRLFILLLGGAACAAGALAWSNLRGGSNVAQTTVSETPRIGSEAGGQEQRANPAVQSAVNLENAQRAERAARAGGSAIPTMNGVPIPLPEPRPFQQQQAVSPQPAFIQTPSPQQTVVPVAPNPNAAALAQLDQNQIAQIQQQIQTIMGAWVLRPSQLVDNRLNGASPSGGTAATTTAPNTVASATGAQGTQATQQAPRYGRLVARAGDVHFGRMVTGATSQSPQAIVAMIDSGPLAGARVIGRFSKTTEGLVMTFNTISIPNVGTATTNILALEPSTNLPPVASNIDRMWFERYAVRMAAAFGSTLAAAYGRQPQTVIMQPTGGALMSVPPAEIGRSAIQGAGRVGEELSAEINQITRTMDLPVVTVQAGKDIALVFTADAIVENR
jgi:intracellular multiplication protein IcmE